MTVEEYIKSKEKFNLMPFVSVYTTIMELVNDGYIATKVFDLGGNSNVATPQSKPVAEVSRGLYCASDFHSNR